MIKLYLTLSSLLFPLNLPTRKGNLLEKQFEVVGAKYHLYPLAV